MFQNRYIKNGLAPLQLEGQIIQRLASTKFLIVRTDENLNWKLHINEVTNSFKILWYNVENSPYFHLRSDCKHKLHLALPPPNILCTLFQ